MSEEKRRDYSTPALDKGLDILQLLAEEPAGLIKSEIARRLGRTMSEIFRMLLTLEDRGYISHTEDDRFSLTLKLFHMVQKHPPTERLLAEALPIMRQLALSTHQSCHLGVLENTQVVILAQVNGPDNTGFYVKLGSIIDVTEAATGQVILAFQSKNAQDAVMKMWSKLTGKPSPRNLRGHLDRIRAAGLEEHASYQVLGVTNLSVPVIGSQGDAVAALTIPYIKRNQEVVDRSQIKEKLLEAAHQISLAIAGTPLDSGNDS